MRNADQILCNIPYLVSRKVQNLQVLNNCFKILIYNKQFLIIMQCTFRSSRPETLCKKGVFKNFAKFIGKYLRQSLFFNKVKRLWHRCFTVNFANFVRTLFLTEHLWWLLLYFRWRHSHGKKVSWNLHINYSFVTWHSLTVTTLTSQMCFLFCDIK